jgi:hypothetical protein
MLCGCFSFCRKIDRIVQDDEIYSYFIPVEYDILTLFSIRDIVLTGIAVLFCAGIQIFDPEGSGMTTVRQNFKICCHKTAVNPTYSI